MTSEVIMKNYFFIAVICIITYNAAGAQAQSPYILFADKNSINVMNLDGSNLRVIVNDTENVLGVDFDYLTNMVYWNEIDTERIYRSSLDGDGTKQLLFSRLSHVEGIAVDWVHRKLYWCNSEDDVIEYSDLDGSNRNVLTSSNIDRPRGLVLDPHNGYIYWTDWGADPRIERMTLSANKRTVLVNSSLEWPNGLTIDYDNQLLYWADALLDKVEFSDLEGNGRTILYDSSSVSLPFGITVYNGVLYWTDRDTFSVVSGPANVSGLAHNVTTGLHRPTAIHIVHPSRQFSNLLDIGRITTTVGSGYAAISWITNDITKNLVMYNVTLKELASDRVIGSITTNKTYHNFTSGVMKNTSYVVTVFAFNEFVKGKIIEGTFQTLPSMDIGNPEKERLILEEINKIQDNCESPTIIYSDYDTISSMNVNGSNLRILVSGRENIVGVDYDFLTNTVYWCEVDNGKIYRAYMSDNSKIELIVTGLGSPEEVAIDWIHRKLYWCDFQHDLIEYSELDGRDRNVLTSSNIDQPRGMALDPHNGYIYWTDWGMYPRIERMTLSATERAVLVYGGLKWPNTLTIDYDNQLLYWADAYLDKIEVSDLEGAGRTVLYSSEPNIHPYGVTLFNGFLYWTDWSSRTINVAQTNITSAVLPITTELTRPTGIHVVHPLRQPRLPPTIHSMTADNTLSYVLVAWNISSEKICNIMYTVTLKEMLSDKVIATVFTAERSCNLTNQLRRNTLYSVNVMGSNDFGNSNTVEEIFKTMPAEQSNTNDTAIGAWIAGPIAGVAVVALLTLVLIAIARWKCRDKVNRPPIENANNGEYTLSLVVPLGQDAHNNLDVWGQ